jgi:cellulose synthase/poly-beta-1,6-N-acetylglucosamine synthase-like glycosyltransferase
MAGKTYQPSMNAEVLLTRGQVAVLASIGAVAVAHLAVAGVNHFLRDAMVAIITLYTLLTAFKVAVWYAGAHAGIPEPPVPSADESDLPAYTVMVPLYQETEVVEGLLRSMSALRYPSDRLQVLLLLETGDDAMLETVARTHLPPTVMSVIVPEVGPRTKPKACNYAMTVATGEYIVIFDAEDRPEPDHLLKAVATMRIARRRDPRVACVQAILRFWNPRSGLPSVFYWSEYVAHFNWTLSGICRLGLIPPLSGSSNHFRTESLWRVADEYGSQTFVHERQAVVIPSVWDAHNVTEDADIALRLARLGYRIAVCPAVTHEEAPHRLKVVLRQRTRWLQGYLVTGLVQSRRPLASIRQLGVVRYLTFNMMMFGAPLTGLLNPLLWATSAIYVLARVRHWTSVTSFIEGIFPPWLQQMGLAVMVAGGLLLLLQALLTTLHAATDQEAGLAKLLLLTFLWWGFVTLPSYRAVWRLITARNTWEKTPHGHDQDKELIVIGMLHPTAEHATIREPVPVSGPHRESGLARNG